MRNKLFAYSVTIILLSSCYITILKPVLGDKINSQNLINPVADANGPYYGIVNQPITFNGSKSYDEDGTIIVYHWYCGDNSLETGMIVTHRYSQIGTYQLLLLIMDNDGNYGCDKTEVIIYEDNSPSLEIIKPIENSIYYKDLYLFPYERDTIIIGEINITVNATDDVGIERVEFYYDQILQHIDYNEPYNWNMPKGHFKHSITVKAYDSVGKTTSTQMEFLQWKIHPILIILSCYLLLRNNEDGLNWISDDRQLNSFLIELIRNIIENDPSIKINLIELINKIQDKNEKMKTSLIIEFLNNHPYLKNKFKQSYPFIYIILFYIKNENSIIKEKILHNFYKDKNLINILFSLPPITDILKSTNDDNLNLFESMPIRWIKDNPLISMGVLLLILLILRQITSGDETSNDTEDEKHYTENKEPNARLDGPKIGYINTPINFSAENSYDEDGTISIYNWDFGDGTRGSGIKLQHIYTKPGNYKVTLSIIDNDGKINIDYLNIEIFDLNYETSDEEDIDMNYILISGLLSSILLIGLIGLKFRRKFFE